MESLTPDISNGEERLCRKCAETLKNNVDTTRNNADAVETTSENPS
jgi:hypothetical protein